MNSERVIGRLWPGEHRHQWTSQQLTIKPTSFTRAVQYEVRMNGDRADVDLDDISLETGSCGERRALRISAFLIID